MSSNKNEDDDMKDLRRTYILLGFVAVVIILWVMYTVVYMPPTFKQI